MNGLTSYYNLESVPNNEWSFTSISLAGTSLYSSQVCFKFNTQSMGCSDMTTPFGEDGTMRSTIGDGFQGYIKSFRVYDYSKEEVDLNKMFRTSGCSPNANGNTCPRCPI